MKLFLKIAIIVLLVLVAAVSSVTGWYFYMQTAPVQTAEAAENAEIAETAEAADGPEPYILKVPVGTGILTVASELEENGLKYRFFLYRNSAPLKF